MNHAGSDAEIRLIRKGMACIFMAGCAFLCMNWTEL